MLTHTIGRLMLAVLTVWLVSVATFLAVEVLPQDPAIAALGHESTREQREAFAEAHGLNRPAFERYVDWATGMLSGDFGTSITSGRPIGETLIPRLRNTAVLAAASLLLSVIIAIPMAIIVARRAGKRSDLIVSLMAMGLSSIPEYVVGIVLLLVFAGALGWFPIVSAGVSEGQLSALVLPSVTLGLAAAAYIFRFARVTLIETLSTSYIQAAVLRGLSPRRVIWGHVMPNAATVIVSVVSLNAILLFGGVITVENVFGYPGLGTLLVSAINTGDLPMIECVAVTTAALLIGINFIADTSLHLLNPRVRAR